MGFALFNGGFKEEASQEGQGRTKEKGRGGSRTWSSAKPLPKDAGDERIWQGGDTNGSSKQAISRTTLLLEEFC